MTNFWSRCGLKRPGSNDTSASTSASFRASSSLLTEDVEAHDNDQARALDRNFTDQDQPREIVRGVISVTVERAENLVSQDANASDPYVVLKTRKGRHSKQSKVFAIIDPWSLNFHRANYFRLSIILNSYGFRKLHTTDHRLNQL